MVDVRIKNIEESDADTLLSEDMSFQGTMSLSRPAMIKGQLAGKIESDSNVFIEKEADVKADMLKLSFMLALIERAKKDPVIGRRKSAVIEETTWAIIKIVEL